MEEESSHLGMSTPKQVVRKKRGMLLKVTEEEELGGGKDHV